MPPRQIHIVDNDPVAAMITQRGLQTMLGDRFTVSVASSPNAAWLACADDRVDLLIVDPSPHVGGVISLVRAVRTFRPSIPVLVLTAYDTPGLRAKMRELGVSAYVAKPVDLHDLLPVVTGALAGMPPRLASGPSLATISASGIVHGK
ncbi:MAG: response regulator [Chloroflexi bacterium]|nr:response regulator [Chloroflexota bacterium]